MQQATLNKARVIAGNGRRRHAAPVSYSLDEKVGKLSVITRICLAVLSLGMITAYFFPLWNIWLAAPQYPEGLKLIIYLDKLGGSIDIINDLNHYIGMQKIYPASFPELSYMVYIVGSLIGLGLLTALINRKSVLIAFTVIFIAVGVTGFVDFYKWEYNYGHNLDPHAAIIVPGMSYQPPVLGSKQLLNFTATSWPATGGFAVILAAAGSLGFSIFELRRKRKR